MKLQYAGATRDAVAAGAYTTGPYNPVVKGSTL